MMMGALLVASFANDLRFAEWHDGGINDGGPAMSGLTFGSPVALPLILMVHRLVQSLSALGRQQFLDIIRDGTKALEILQERRGLALLVDGRRHAGRRELHDRIDNLEVPRNLGVQGGKELVFGRGRGVCNLQYPGPCGLHARRELHRVGVDIVDTLVVMAPDSTNLGIELTKTRLVYWGNTGYSSVELTQQHGRVPVASSNQ